MSFRILILQLTGQLRATEMIEAARRETEEKYRAFLDAESSKELADYRELEKWMQSGELKSRKKEIESLVFKGSEEYNQLREFESLRNSKPVRNYFKITGSPELERFAKIEGSDKLKNYWQLKDFVEGQFLQEKREIEARRFEGSPEERLLNELNQFKKSKALKSYFRLKDSSELKKHTEFQKSTKLHRFLELKNLPFKDKDIRMEFGLLKKDGEIREFFKFENSRELKYYHKMEGRHVLSRYEELLSITNSDAFRQKVAFLKDKKKLEKSDSWNKFQRFKELASSEDILFHRKFKKSPPYRNYLDMKESFQLERYSELKELTSSSGFLKRKAYLEDKKKWEKTEEYAKEQRFLQLKRDPKVELYYRYAGSTVFDFLKNWEVAFSDDFDGKILDKTRWTPNTLWADRLLGDNYSQPGDLQAYTGGKNTIINQSRLVIQVRKEKSGGKQWQPNAGFVPVAFDYTSDTLSTVNGFWQADGIIEAKICFAPVKEVVSSFYLLGEKTSPQITVAEMGPKCRAGILSADTTSKPVFSGTCLKNLRKGKFYIFRLERQNNHLTWKINDKVIFKTGLSGLNDSMHLNLTSLVVDEIGGSKLPVAFETDWIRCYRKKSHD